MFLFYVLSFFKKGDTIQGKTFFYGNMVYGRRFVDSILVLETLNIWTNTLILPWPSKYLPPSKNSLNFMTIQFPYLIWSFLQIFCTEYQVVERKNESIFFFYAYVLFILDLIMICVRTFHNIVSIFCMYISWLPSYG